MKKISTFLQSDHARCDTLFEAIEANVTVGLWLQAEINFACFEKTLMRHMAMEEDVMFPAFEKAFGNSAGTDLLRSEHRHIRGVVDRLHDSIQHRHAIDFFDHTDSFHSLMQLHYLKENEILHPIVDRILGDRENDIIDSMMAVDVSSAQT